MKVLVVGGGGREHALAWKLKQSPKVTKLYITPGNGGTAMLGENLAIKSSMEILEWLKNNPMDLVVIGPDDYLADGLADSVQALGMKVFGPTKAAAEIEWSKSYAKQLMLEEGIPTARYELFTDVESALAYVQEQTFPVVVKADGLAAGKGVVIAETLQEAELALHDIMTKKVHGDSGSTVVIEEYLEGFEISVHAFCDGNTAVLFPSAKDHKRIFENDKGPNTGGMGTIAPVPLVSEEQMRLVRERIVTPLLAGLKKRGRTFKGLLFPGIMLTKDGPKVIEFNARFGDPETQSYLRILETDLFDILSACAKGSLNEVDVKWSDKSACCIVLAAPGYPGSYEKEIPITLPVDSGDIVVFQAGTSMHNGQLVTNGGRVLGVTATGTTLRDALATAYAAISPDVFKGVQYRKDIGATSF